MRAAPRAWLRPLLVLGLALALGACEREPTISDTGYVGTWSKGTERSRSTISIRRKGDAYQFRWGASSADGNWKVRCDWSGRCEEFVDGEKTSDYRFRTWVDPRTNLLMVECRGKVFKPNQLDVHYVDQLEVEPGGRVLWSYTLERGGQRFDGDARPRRFFEKVSDEVVDDPSGSPS